MPIFLLQKLASKNGVIAVLSVAFVLVLADAYRQREEVKRIEAVYQNPEVKIVERIVQIAGPVQTVVKIIERPTGEKETTITKTQAPSTQTTEKTTEKAPVSLAQTMTPYRSDRYLLTFGVNSLTEDFRGKAILAGYGFKNRLDVQAGIIRTDRSTGWVLATLRF